MIDDLLAARLQMAVSLGFHILFSVAGMAMPCLMVLAEYWHQRTGDAVYRDLAQRWAKGTAILFAVGAISGTVLSFELGLLWPTFMEHAGPLIGMPFSLEGLAFFMESIALGIYLYGWDRVSPRVHLASGVVVAVSGAASGVLVIAVNAFMNTPQGFTRNAAGELTSVDLWQAFFTPAFPTQALHMLIAAYSSVGFAVLGIHAWSLWRRGHHPFHAAALQLTLPLVMIAAPLQALTGDLAAKHIAEYQPSKLAAAEALWETQRGAPFLIGGIPLEGGREVILGLHVPKALSFLAKSDPDAEVMGLADIPEGQRPPVLITHLAFQIMVGAGVAMLALVAWAGWLRWRKKADLARHRRFLMLATVSGPLGLIGVEAGWCVTEVGRQPWIIRDVLLVSEAVTPMPGLVYSLLACLAVYALLGGVVALLLYRHVVSVPIGAAESGGPGEGGRSGLAEGAKVPAR